MYSFELNCVRHTIVRGASTLDGSCSAFIQSDLWQVESVPVSKIPVGELGSGEDLDKCEDCSILSARRSTVQIANQCQYAFLHCLCLFRISIVI